MLRTGHFRPAFLGLALGALSAAAVSAPMTYNVDSNHSYPSFEADHQGISFWRGKFNSTTGSITMDKATQSGTIEITVDMNSIDFGHDDLNTHAKTPDIFDAAQYPTATYEGTLTNWVDGAPTAVNGELTMHGVTRPVTLEIRHFGCRSGRGGGETCGADAYAEINRADFGVNFGEQMGMNMNVVLRIQVEAASQ